MKGKPTVGKARALREKRELAAELSKCDEARQCTFSFSLTIASKDCHALIYIIASRHYASQLTTDDVQEFEAARGLSSTRSSRSKAKAKTAVQRDSGSSNEEEERASDASQVRLSLLYMLRRKARTADPRAPSGPLWTFWVMMQEMTRISWPTASCTCI